MSFDLLGVTLAAAALLAWGRSRPLLAGVLLGLAFTARSYPVVLLLALALVALRAGRWREWVTTALAALVTVVAVFVAVPAGERGRREAGLPLLVEQRRELRVAVAAAAVAALGPQAALDHQARAGRRPGWTRAR